MSASESFDNFVRRQQEQTAASKDFDYEAEKNEYLARLEDLYVQVRFYLDDYINAGTVRLDSSALQLDEEGIGTYWASRFIIVIGSQQITLTPIGTLLIGSKGRVDVAGSAGKARLALVDRQARDVRDTIKPAKRAKEVNWTWKIMSPPPSTTFIDLDRESFLTMILEISGG